MNFDDKLNTWIQTHLSHLQNDDKRKFKRCYQQTLKFYTKRKFYKRKMDSLEYKYHNEMVAISNRQLLLIKQYMRRILLYSSAIRTNINYLKSKIYEA